MGTDSGVLCPLEVGLSDFVRLIVLNRLEQISGCEEQG